VQCAGHAYAHELQGLAAVYVCTMETFFGGWYCSMEGAAVRLT